LAMNMTYNTLSNVSKLFDTNDHKVIGIGVPCCLSATSKRFLVIGTSLSNIVLFEVGLKQHKVL
jgi:predicted NBD/HSP70 family sugar kinase